MMNLLLARWQFGITTTFHFLFAPLTIGLAFLIAMIESRYVATGNPAYQRMAKFWGKLFLINFALGVVTGIMQEFQFGMNWSNYSRFVGDIFGAPLAIESLAAFFLESTFVAVWLFGWERLPKGVHLMSIWLVVFGASFSAVWILAANAFMQEPVGFVVRHGRAEMTNFFALITSHQFLVEFPHVWFGTLATGAFFVTGVSAWYILKKRNLDLFERSFRMGIVIALLSSVLTVVMGHQQAQHLITAQPMKMAASEALWNTSPRHAPWSLITGIDEAHQRNTFQVKIPYLLSILAYNRPSGRVIGMKQLQSRDQQVFGPGDYIPSVWVSYWSFRMMVFAGLLMIFLALYGTYLAFRRRLRARPFYLRIMCGP